MLTKVHFSCRTTAKICQSNISEHDPHQKALKRKWQNPGTAWKCTLPLIKEHQMFCTCQHLHRAGAGRSILHQLRPMITSTHPLLRQARMTCMPPHSTANYFLFQAGCCTESQWHIQQQRLKNIFLPHTHTDTHTKALESARFSHMCTDFDFSGMIICPNFLVVSPFTHKIKKKTKKQPARLNHYFSSYAKLWLAEILGKYLSTSRESSQLSMVNNLSGCLRGRSRQEAVTAALRLFPCTFKDPLNVPDVMRRGTTPQKVMILLRGTSFPSFAWGQYREISAACFLSSSASRTFWVFINTERDRERLIES